MTTTEWKPYPNPAQKKCDYCEDVAITVRYTTYMQNHGGRAWTKTQGSRISFLCDNHTKKSKARF